MRVKLLFVKDVLHYAEREGLFVGNAYKEVIFNSDQNFVSHLLQVAYPFELRWVTWSYPVVGAVPYQGFFDQSPRDKEAVIWQAKGFDVKKGKASAFSTLGWFSDPIYSSMLRMGDSDLAETLFHELVHRSFWLKDDVSSNEQLATFISQKMTVSYLGSRARAKDLENYKLYLKDRKLFYNWFRNFKEELRTFYKTLNQKTSLEDQKKGKNELFNKFLVDNKPKFHRYDFTRKNGSWNNADILSRSLYHPDFEFFDKYYLCSKAKTPGSFLEALKQSKKKDFQEKLNDLCLSIHKAS